ncbi:cation:proton antiporter [Demequina sp.]|uniref:cation:proton antiporter n=1 Tax=Demequina sp. TaxID=2050685 RepID=UPI003D127BD4
MGIATTLVVILAAGLASQVIAARIRVPAIVVLIVVGLTLGPITGLVKIPAAPAEVSEVVGLGVAVILFEGAMGLKLTELRRVGHGVGRLTILGPPVAFVLGTFAAAAVGGFSAQTSVVLGAILVVTGPTVIIPMLRQANLKRDVASLLKWEGIVNDPIGVLLATIMFQAVTLSSGTNGGLWKGFGLAILMAVVLGGGVGWITAKAFQHGWIPTHLKSPTLLALVLVVFSLANMVQDEAGLLVVTAMGVVLGNAVLSDREALLSFKESLTVVLLSALFIIIPAELSLADIKLLDWRVVAFVLVLMFVVRPVTVLLVTIGAKIPRSDRLLMAWIAPRGIVAAATAGVFGPAMVSAGFEDGRMLLPTVFFVILVTVVVHSITLKPWARALGLLAGVKNGLLIVGGSAWATALAAKLRENSLGALIADNAYAKLQPARMDNVPTYFGEVLSDKAEEEMDLAQLSYVLAASDNDYYNALVARELGRDFEYHRTFQLATHVHSHNAGRQLGFGKRGSFAFDGLVDFAEMARRYDAGWRFHVTKAGREFPRERFEAAVTEAGAVPIGAIDTQGLLRVYSPDQPFRPKRDSRLIYFAPRRLTLE